MNTNNKNFLITGAVVVGLLLVFLLMGGDIPFFGNISPVTGSNSSSTVGTAGALVMSSQSGAQYRSITNIGLVTVYLILESTSTGFVAGTGIALPASTTLQLSEGFGNLWTGNIYGKTLAGTTTLSKLQK